MKNQDIEERLLRAMCAGILNSELSLQQAYNFSQTLDLQFLQKLCSAISILSTIESINSNSQKIILKNTPPERTPSKSSANKHINSIKANVEKRRMSRSRLLMEIKKIDPLIIQPEWTSLSPSQIIDSFLKRAKKTDVERLAISLTPYASDPYSIAISGDDN